MSNLWKALRDVSRDAEPAVGFEPPAQGARPDGFGLASALSDLAGSPVADPGASGEEGPASPTPLRRVPPGAAGGVRDRLAEARSTVEPHGSTGMARPAGPNHPSGPWRAADANSAATRASDVDEAAHGDGPTEPAPGALTNLPKALRAFAPGAPDAFHMAATVGAPQWHPGDDDVMPKDGRRAVKARLRNRFSL